MIGFDPRPCRALCQINDIRFEDISTSPWLRSLWGIAATLGRAVFTGRLLPFGHALRLSTPLILSQSRTTLSFLALFTGSRSPARMEESETSSHRLREMFSSGSLGVAASNYCYYFAIQKTNVATAIILQYTAPVWVLLYMAARGLQKAFSKRVPGGWAGSGGKRASHRCYRNGPIPHECHRCCGSHPGGVFFLRFYKCRRTRHLRRGTIRWKVLLWTLLAASVFWVIVINPPRTSAMHFGEATPVYTQRALAPSGMGLIGLPPAGELYFRAPVIACSRRCVFPLLWYLILALYARAPHRKTNTLLYRTRALHCLHYVLPARWARFGQGP